MGKKVESVPTDAASDALATQLAQEAGRSCEDIRRISLKVTKDGENK